MFKSIPLSFLLIKSEYQREERKKHARKIVAYCIMETIQRSLRKMRIILLKLGFYFAVDELA